MGWTWIYYQNKDGAEQEVNTTFDNDKHAHSV